MKKGQKSDELENMRRIFGLLKNLGWFINCYCFIFHLNMFPIPRYGCSVHMSPSLKASLLTTIHLELAIYQSAITLRPVSLLYSTWSVAMQSNMQTFVLTSKRTLASRVVLSFCISLQTLRLSDSDSAPHLHQWAFHDLSNSWTLFHVWIISDGHGPLRSWRRCDPVIM